MTPRILIAAVREYKTTALTKAFVLGTIVLPLVIWGLIIFVTSTGILNSTKEPLRGTIAVVDGTPEGVVVTALRGLFDPEEQARRREAQLAELRRMMDQAPMGGLMPEVTDEQLQQAGGMLGIAEVAEVDLEVLGEDADLAVQRERVASGELRALVVADEASMRPWIAPAARERDGAAPVEEPDALPDGVYSVVLAEDMDVDHAERMRREISLAIVDARMRRASIDPDTVRAIRDTAPRGQATTLSADGEEKDAAGNLRKALPMIFMALLFVSAVTGGQYLLMGTLEEKSSRVMEVVLSAISPRELLIGKLVGQGLVGLTTLGIYLALGVGIADRFDVLASIPLEILPWMLIYFLMAYAFFGAMMLAVGSAVTEIREAQALYAPITLSMMLPFVLMFPVLDNPSGLVARVASYVPPATPFVMVMRMSDVAHEPPLWEKLATVVVGAIGVAVVVWMAAKIFRVGVLMYGKPPSLIELLKWVRYA